MVWTVFVYFGKSKEKKEESSGVGSHAHENHKSDMIYSKFIVQLYENHCFICLDNLAFYLIFDKVPHS